MSLGGGGCPGGNKVTDGTGGKTYRASADAHDADEFSLVRKKVETPVAEPEKGASFLSVNDALECRRVCRRNWTLPVEYIHDIRYMILGDRVVRSQYGKDCYFDFTFHMNILDSSMTGLES